VKILYLSSGGNTQDYLRDCVFHGLRSLLGPDVVDVNKLDSLYVGADRSQMYGRGMTLYSELPDIPVDRIDIPRKIATRYFDLVIYGSIHRNQDYLHEVASMYQAPYVIFLDGEDHPGYLNGLGGLTFKRELYNPQPGCLPIHFAIPAEKILSEPPHKSRLMALMDPLNKSSYIYKEEADYYAGYAKSFYAATNKRAGWDCMRHYEILANWCIPYFRVFDQCPPLICQRLPRRALRLVQECFDSGLISPTTMEHIYDNLIDEVMSVVMRDLTTEALARYIFDSIGVSKKETVCVS
jgi:hypothetical protein